MGPSVGCAQLPSSTAMPKSAQPALVSERTTQSYDMPKKEKEEEEEDRTGSATALAVESGNTYQTYIEEYVRRHNLDTDQISKDNGNAKATSGSNDDLLVRGKPHQEEDEDTTGNASASALGSGNTWQVWVSRFVTGNDTKNRQDSEGNGNATATSGSNK
jgi:hypothetical protein